MGLLSSLFAKKGTAQSSESRASTLVFSAQAAAVSAFVPFLDRFPVLKTINPKAWDEAVTVAGVFIASMQINRMQGSARDKEMMMNNILIKLRHWNAKSVDFIQNCKAHFEAGCESSPEEKSPRLIITDSLGSWVLIRLLSSPSNTEEELGRAIGTLAVEHAERFWA